MGEDVGEALAVVIRARPGSLGLAEEARELWRYRHLVRTLVERDLRVRYKNSVLGVAWPDGHTEEFEGKVDGTLIWPPRGDQGFGYDPMFLPDGFGLTFGEMSRDQKHGLPPQGQGLSHRARAFLKLAEACLGRR